MEEAGTVHLLKLKVMREGTHQVVLNHLQNFLKLVLLEFEVYVYPFENICYYVVGVPTHLGKSQVLKLILINLEYVFQYRF